ncbi:MAG TPA: RNA polymerase sigma-54 factor, partial [Tissierellaceae bacterium]|nr:RNA polymerase sigma-54 factor [Tissierellaceae bacterium]
MELGFDLKLEQTQKLIMTQELRQAIQLLQFNSFELNQYLKNEIEENPMLELESGLEEMEMVKELPNEREVDWKEFIEKYDDVSYKPQVDKNQEEYSYESFISYEPTLKEYLLNQLNLVKIDEKKYIIAEYIIQSIDENGYLKSTVEEIAYLLGASLAQVEEALRLVQSFEPTG